MGQWRTKDLRMDNGRRGIQEWDNGERRISEGIIEEEGRRGIQEWEIYQKWDNRDGGIQKGLWRRKVITIERDRKKWKHSRKGHRRSGDYGKGREKVDER
jgi:hypothetical protein